MCGICNNTNHHDSISALQSGLGLSDAEMIATLGKHPDEVVPLLQIIYDSLKSIDLLDWEIARFLSKSRKAGEAISSLKNGLITGDTKKIKRIIEYVGWVLKSGGRKYA